MDTVITNSTTRLEEFIEAALSQEPDTFFILQDDFTINRCGRLLAFVPAWTQHACISACSGGFFVRGGAGLAAQRSSRFLSDWYAIGEVSLSLQLDWRMHDQVYFYCSSQYHLQYSRALAMWLILRLYFYLSE